VGGWPKGALTCGGGSIGCGKIGGGACQKKRLSEGANVIEGKARVAQFHPSQLFRVTR
jgi:hypothetical protein